MHSSQHPDHPARRPAADAPHLETLQDLIARVRGLREDVEALRRGEPSDAADHRVRDAVWEDALGRLEDFGRQLGQLTPAVPSGRAPLGGRVGSAEWSLLTDAVVWSEELYPIFGRPPAEGPLTLDQLPSCLVEADQPVLAGAVTVCLVDGRPAVCEFRVARPDGSLRTVQLAAEPILDEAGSTVAMWAVVRDVSGTAAAPEAGGAGSAAARVPEQGPRAPARPEHAEHRLAVVAPDSRGTPWRSAAERRPNGVPRSLEVAARSLSGAAVGGVAEEGVTDGRWHDWLDLRDGSTVLSVGDLSGSGPSAATATAALLGALRGIALTGTRPGELLEHLNDLMDRGTQPVLAGLVCCRYRAEDGALTWAQAGHPAPLLCREGSARLLPRPAGTLLGAIAGTVYGERVDRLRSGDTLVLHTDGLFPPGPPGPDGRGGSARSSDPVLLTLAPRLAAAADAREALELLVERRRRAEREGGALEDSCVMVARVR
ncbi:SpoIIE family protein phosphatase [Streptomyces otsuchiensis]|uniref:SpoIIE family protein phosphatase n=2 Tax=Streptomyces TaxID=1883 RepID=UPI001030D49A|nr:SpoIIE family protein phosphatase [Streptomyces otsuchiensis]